VVKSDALPLEAARRAQLYLRRS